MSTAKLAPVSAADELQSALGAMGLAFECLDRAAGGLTSHENAACVQLRVQQGDLIRRLGNLIVFADHEDGATLQ